MVFKKKTKRRHHWKPHFRRHRDKRIPILTTAAVAGNELVALSPTIALAESHAPPMDILKSFFHEHIVHWTGLHINMYGEGYSWDYMKPIYSVGSVVATGLVGKAAGKYVNPTIKKIPLLGKYIKL